jgi:RNA recognition motif-containing protein
LPLEKEEVSAGVKEKVTLFVKNIPTIASDKQIIDLF